MQWNPKKIAIALAVPLASILVSLVVFAGLPWRKEFLKCFHVPTGDLVFAERRSFGFEPETGPLHYRIVAIRPTIFSAIFDSDRAHSDVITITFDETFPMSGVLENGYLAMDKSTEDAFGRLTGHASMLGISYFFDLPEIGMKVSNARPKGLAFQEYLRNKEKEVPGSVRALQASFLSSTAGENKVWDAMIEEFDGQWEADQARRRRNGIDWERPSD